MSDARDDAVPDAETGAAPEADAAEPTDAVEPARIESAPEYGAFASPEEQARRRGLTGDDASEAVAAAVTADRARRTDHGVGSIAAASPETAPSPPAPVSTRPAADQQPSSAPGHTAPLGTPPPGQPVWSWTTPRRESRFVASGADRVLTLVLLALGIVNLITSAPNLLDFGAAMATVYSMMDAGEFTATELADSMGIVALVVQVALFLAVAWWSLARLRARRLTWWLPLAGAVVAWIVVTVVVVIVLMTDPPSLADASTAASSI